MYSFSITFFIISSIFGKIKFYLCNQLTTITHATRCPQVCDQRQQQVDANLDLLRDRQRDTLHHREQLLADLEQLQVQTSRQQYAVQEATTVRREELECQVGPRVCAR